MKKTAFIIIASAIALMTACKKNDVGGEATVAAFPKHHERPIKGATIYVKFDAEDMPSDITTNYDLKIDGEANEDHVHIENLRYGHYYLYSVGYDSTIMQVVKGGIPIKIKWSERKEEIDIDVPVTE